MSYTYYRRYQPKRKSSSFRPFFCLVVILVVLSLLLRACVSLVQRINDEQRDEAILSVDQGAAEITLYGQSEALAVADAQIVHIGDLIETQADSWVTLEFYNGTELRLDEDTRLTFVDFTMEEPNENVYLQLHEGRVWLEHIPKELGEFEIKLETDVMNLTTSSGQYLASNGSAGEALYVLEGQVNIEYVERGQEELVIERALLNRGYRSVLDSATKTALLARENVTLVSEILESLVGDAFVMWNLGTFPLSAEPQEEEAIEEVIEEVVEEVEPEEPAVVLPEVLTIGLDSPSSPASIQKDAIAIEGSILRGSAERVSVTWSGNGQAYDLGLFESGSSSFRYVADVEYGNFSRGENTYTIVAYDAEGKVSNTLSVVINADF